MFLIEEFLTINVLSLTDGVHFVCLSLLLSVLFVFMSIAHNTFIANRDALTVYKFNLFRPCDKNGTIRCVPKTGSFTCECSSLRHGEFCQDVQENQPDMTTSNTTNIDDIAFLYTTANSTSK